MSTDAPRLRIFDNPSFNDRYTVVFDDGTEQLQFIGMNDIPFHPAGGFCEHGEVTREWLDTNTDREITYDELPDDCKKIIARELAEWNDPPTSTH